MRDKMRMREILARKRKSSWRFSFKEERRKRKRVREMRKPKGSKEGEACDSAEKDADSISLGWDGAIGGERWLEEEVEEKEKRNGEGEGFEVKGKRKRRLFLFSPAGDKRMNDSEDTY